MRLLNAFSHSSLRASLCAFGFTLSFICARHAIGTARPDVIVITAVHFVVAAAVARWCPPDSAPVDWHETGIDWSPELRCICRHMFCGYLLAQQPLVLEFFVHPAQRQLERG